MPEVQPDIAKSGVFDTKQGGDNEAILGEVTQKEADPVVGTLYIEDNWNDNSLVGNPRAGHEESLYLAPNAKIAGDSLVARRRPDWDSVSGSPSAVNEQLELPDGSSTSQRVSTTSGLEAGVWVWDVATSSGAVDLIFMSETDDSVNNQDGYSHNIGGNGDNQLVKWTGGSTTILIEAVVGIDDGTMRTLRAERDSYGNFEIFDGGTSRGTATDTTYTSTKHLTLENRGGSVAEIDNLEVQ